MPIRTAPRRLIGESSRSLTPALVFRPGWPSAFVEDGSLNPVCGPPTGRDGRQAQQGQTGDGKIVNVLVQKRFSGRIVLD